MPNDRGFSKAGSYMVKRSQLVIMMRAIALESFFKIRRRMRWDTIAGGRRMLFPDFTSYLWRFEGDCVMITRGPDRRLNLCSSDSYRVTGTCEWVVDDFYGRQSLQYAGDDQAEWRYKHDGIVSDRTAEAMRRCRRWIEKVGGFSKALEILRGERR